MSLGNLGNSYYEMPGRRQKAIDFDGQALAIFREVKDQSDEATMLSDLGTAYRDLSQHDRAIAFHLQALLIRREIKARFEEAEALSDHARLAGVGPTPFAIFYGKQAVNALQAIRSDIGGLSRESQQSFLKGNEKSYHTLADLLITQGRLAEASRYSIC